MRSALAPRHRQPAPPGGFTLIELMIVVVVLTTLASVAMPLFNDSVSDARLCTLNANLRRLRDAVTCYRIEHADAWPGQAGAGELVRQLTAVTAGDGSPGDRYGPYLRTGIPLNPFTHTNDVRVVAAMPDAPPGGEAWIYSWATGDLRANLAGVTPDGVDFFRL